MSPRYKRIDVHHHFVPPPYAAAFKSDPSGWKLPPWSAQESKALMTELSIDTTILSLTAPGTGIATGAACRQLSREVNAFAASVRDADPSFFGFFAAIPSPLDDMEGALAEMAYALDTLRADGITLYTRYGAGNSYLGHEAFRPLWKALDERKAVVFVHPTHTVDTALVNPHLPQPMIDYPHETCRTAIDLVMSDNLRQFPDVKIILSHAGGTLPFLVTRAAVMLPDYKMTAKTAEEFMADAKRFYFDLALSSNEYQLPLMLKFVGAGRLMFGSDFPYAPTETIRTHAAMLDAFSMSEEEEEMVARGTALILFPRLKGV